MSTDMNHIPCLYIPFHNRNTRRTHPVLTSFGEKGELTSLPPVGVGTKIREDYVSDWFDGVDSPVKKPSSMVTGEINERALDFPHILGLLNAT